MNRGRLKWEDMQRIAVPLRDKSSKSATTAVAAMKDQWAAHSKLASMHGGYIKTLADDLKLDGRTPAYDGLHTSHRSNRIGGTAVFRQSLVNYEVPRLQT